MKNEIILALPTLIIRQLAEHYRPCLPAKQGLSTRRAVEEGESKQKTQINAYFNFHSLLPFIHSINGNQILPCA